jgi:hypothetical protein
MKAAVNKITEEAKRRDTIGRNQVLVIHTKQTSLVQELIRAQRQVSSDNIEKVTNLIVTDDETKVSYLLKYRCLVITSNQFYENDSRQNESLEEVGGSNNDKEWSN